jgi:hypothetical protein
MSDDGNLEREDFASLAAPLRVLLRDGVVLLTVKSTHALPAHALRAAPFSVVLQGPAQTPLPQGTFAVEHPVRGRFDLFLVPIARSAASVDYEAVFN